MNLSWLLPEIKGIPVLMYHKVWPGINDGLTITPEKLRQQWEYLKNEGYYTVSLHQFLELINNGNKLTGKPLLLTFDDGYLNNYEYVYPLLKQLGWQAVFFITADTLEQATLTGSKTPGQKMSLQQLQMLDPAIVQLGLHGYRHENFSNATLEDIVAVLQKSMELFEQHNITYNKVLAYPYGARPKNIKITIAMKKWMAANGITAAFRIGNQVSRLPPGDIYEIKRMDIKGTDTLEEFKIKLKKGKLKPF